MMAIPKNTARALRGASRILLLCIIHASCAVAVERRPVEAAIAEGRNTRFGHETTKAGFRGEPGGRADSPPRHFQDIRAEGRDALVSDLRFTHVTTNDGLSQGYVTAILQDRLGFMWFATRDGLNRYDGNAFLVYKNNPNDPGSLSSNFIQDLMEDDHGDLWIATNTGVDKFDPATERFTRYLQDPKNPNSIGGAYVTSIARDSRGYLWFGTQDAGLDRFDPTTGIFAHYRNDSDGQFVGGITQVIEGNRQDIWFVGDRGLFHLNQKAGQITRPPATGKGLSADSVYEDETGDLWMLTHSPIVGLVKYDRRSERFTRYPLDPGAVGVLASTMNGGSLNGKLVADGTNGLWVPSSQGLYYFDWRTQRFTYRFQHDESNPDSLDSNAVMSVYQDRSGVLWVGTENTGLNLLNFRQEQFVRYRHRPSAPKSISPGRVKAIYEDSDGVLWIGFFPRALNRLDRKTGQITHYVSNPGDGNGLGKGTNVDSLYKDRAGYLWVGGGGSGLDRFDGHTGRFTHYRHNPDDPNSLISDNVYTIYGDRNGHMWVGGQYGLSRFDPATDGFTNYRPVPTDPASLANWVWTIYQDHSGAMWLGTFGGALIRFDDKTKTFVTYAPDSRDPHKLNGGGLTSIHEDRTGTLWVGAFDGLYRFNRQSGTFDRYTEGQGLPSSTIRCIQEDGLGRLWLSTQKGISRFDPQTETFRNYDVFDGLQTNEFSDGCYQGPDGEMFFGGSNGFNAFFPEQVRDNTYVPPVVITSFKVFNKPVPVGAKSVLKKAIPYVHSLTLSYRDNVFSFEFAALSYVNSFKNRYRYRLEGFEPGWNEVGSKQRLATYTNLDPAKYVFRVQGSNSDGVWNEEGVSLPILITPPWWKTTGFRALCLAAFLALLWAAYQVRVRQLQEQERKFREAVETMPALAFVALPDGYRTFVNRGWVEYTGMTVEQASGSGWQVAIHPDDLKRVIERWRTSAAKGEPLEYEARLRRGVDGEYRWFQTRARPLRDKRGKVVKWCGVATDIEDRKRAEQLQADLAHTNRISLLGELAASISHELKQPITGAMANARASLRWLKRDQPDLQEACDAIGKIVRDGARATEIIDRLRSLYKKTPPQRELVDVNKIIGEMVVLLRGEANRCGVSMRTDLAADLPKITADRVQVQQVLMNLMLNAIEAMKETGGVLTVKSQRDENGGVLVSVSDTGVGLPPDKADQIFNAFFTTKPQGSGMGLAISRSIVEWHGGHLWATPNDGRGASFHFTLPTAAAEAPATVKDTIEVS
jgi:PAS domain S-box-containing protein